MPTPFQTTLNANPSDVLLLVEQMHVEAGNGLLLNLVDSSGLHEGGIEFLVETDLQPAPDLRITLKPDGTWTAHTIVTIGE